MSAVARPYAGAADLLAIQDAVSAWDSSSCRTLHPGDMAHRFYNALRIYDLSEWVRVWEDGGELVGWALVFPQWQAWDAMAAPGRPDVLEQVLDWSEATAAALDPTPDDVQADVCDCDTEREAALLARGYRKGDQLYWATSRSLSDLPEPKLPGGFSIRAVTGLGEAGALAELHHAAFGSKWTAEEYAQYMTSPAYDPARELVVVAPDGRLAAFCICWPDERNRIGLFEPVGTHRDFRRLGLGRALLFEGMRRMRDWGMTEATVLYEVDNEASGALYRDVGFEHRLAIWDYKLAL